MVVKYQAYTVGELIKELQNFAKDGFSPKGYDTPVVLGDFEGNYIHKLMEVMYNLHEDGTIDIFIGYERHEGFGGR